jgi:hypothetical protein
MGLERERLIDTCSQQERCLAMLPWRRLAAGTLAPVMLAALAACGGGAEAGAHRPSGTHTMPDGTVMQGSEHLGGDDHHPHDSGHAEHPRGHVAGPSPAARMVCAGSVADDVTRILALESEPEASSAWNTPMFSCTYDLDEGPLVLTVHDAAEERAGKGHFDTVRAELGNTTPLVGMYGLGLPAFETDDGTVVFLKDGKTLRVDATELPNNLGPDDDMSQTELAYAVATSVLACWTKHA